MFGMKRNNAALVAVLMCSGFGAAAFGQDSSSQAGQPAPVQQDPSPGWHRFGERAPDPNAGTSAPAPVMEQAPQQQQQFPQQQQQFPQQQIQSQPQGQSQSYATPSSLVVPAGTWVTVRMNQGLSSDRNQPGDAFTATLAEPLVAQGLVVARRGMTVGGRVSTAQKAGRVSGTASIGVELTELSLVDGQQIPVKTQLVARQGDTSVGRDIAAAGTTTGLGAAIGAAAGGGIGAAIGAGAGLVVGATGVLSTRGRPSIIYPETVLTFRLEQPLTISSQNMMAFQPAREQDYRPNQNMQGPGYRAGTPYPAPAPAYGYAPAPYPYVYGPAYYGYPSFSFYARPGFFYRGYGRRW